MMKNILGKVAKVPLKIKPQQAGKHIVQQLF